MRRLRPSFVVLTVGGLAMLVGAAVVGAGWYARYSWQGSEEAQRATRNLAAAPVWITPEATGIGDEQVVLPTPPVPAHPTATLGRVPATALSTPASQARTVVLPQAAPTGVPTPVPEATSPELSLPAAPLPTPEPTRAPPPIELLASDFRFLDPPQPGAHVHLTISVHNISDAPSGPIRVALPLGWLDGYQIQTSAPSSGDDPTGVTVGKERVLSFDGLDPDDVADLTVDFVTTDEVVDPPTARVLDAAGDEVGQAHPPTLAPPAPPGPVYALDVPRLNIHSAVVPVDWEPPLFVVGQVRGSAYVTEGNTVLVGHLRGSLGNVFDQLDHLAVGDSIVAQSRGEDYDFTVTQTAVLPADDTTPTEPNGPPRLTLMTCTGVWDPLKSDYTERLWVIAEPSEVAAAAIASNVPVIASPTPVPQPSPTPIGLLVPGGGLGDTDRELANQFGPPTGQIGAGLAVYRHADAEYHVGFGDVPDAGASRAELVAVVAPDKSPFALDQAQRLARKLLPSDAAAQGKVEGNASFAVEHFTSASLGSALPPDWFASSSPGDLLAVYVRRPDGRVTTVVVGPGDDPTPLLARASPPG